MARGIDESSSRKRVKCHPRGGAVSKPHPYCRKTRQLAIRTPNAKAKSDYSYCVLVTTDLTSPLENILTDYDRRSGIPESVFCQDNQGLAARKRRKKNFIAQQMLMLLTQLAHNLLLWIKQWSLDAIELCRKADAWVAEICKQLEIDATQADTLFDSSIASLGERGIKRWVNPLLALSGQLVFADGQLRQLILIPGYPLLNRIVVAFSALLTNYSVEGAVAET